jgi:hypothetical protein
MMRCDACQARLLEYQYGLLEPAEQAAVEEHLAACSRCPAALAEATRTRELFARAAKLSFCDVRFVPPTESAITAKPTTPVRGIRREWHSWVVAAALVLAFGGICVPVARDWFDYRRLEPSIRKSLAQLDASAAASRSLAAEAQAAVADAEAARQAAEQRHDRTVAEWVATDLRENADRGLKLIVSGPASAAPGAPNDYTVEVLGRDQTPVLAEITATVRVGETEHFTTTFTWDPAAKDRTTIHLPAALWAELPAEAMEVVLTVTARDPKTGATATLAEPIKLLTPVHTTFLVTDKPLYRPGEPVFFRSVTLDRTTFQPPSRDLTLRYEITRASDPARAEVIAKVTGRAEPVQPVGDGAFEPVIGPDGQPVRGIGCGVFQLDKELPGGEYVLTVYEVPASHPNEAPRPAVSAPLATRKFTVLKYQPEMLLKTLEFDASSYGPGDTVRAKLTVRDQAKPAAGAFAIPEVKGIAVAPAPVTTADDGTATIIFTLPNVLDLPAVSLSVLVSYGVVSETIVRPVPIISPALAVEFFPEGGDLVTGVPNRVYFRAATAAGKPADIDGFLTDGTRSITSVKTVADPNHPGVNQGFGMFTFTPEPGKRYAVKLLRPTSAVETIDPTAASLVGGLAVATAGVYPLPRAVANGVVMSIPEGVIDANQPIRVMLRSNEQRELFVGAYCRGVPVAAGRVTVEAGRPAEVLLAPQAGAVGGVTRVTVFEEPDPARGRHDLNPVAERLIFRRPAKTLKLGITPDRPGYAPGEPVQLDITATTEAGTPAPAVLLVAVVNQSVLTMADDRAERQLPTHFLLAGEIRKPDDLEHADFFLTDHPKAAESLDLLLGTQGWRRFAEQAPGRFRATVDDEEGSRFLVSAGLRPNLTTAYESTAAVRFISEYHEAARDYAAARLRAWQVRNEYAVRMQAASDEEDASRTAFVNAAQSAWPAYANLDTRRSWLLAAAVAGLLLGLAALAVPRFSGPPRMFAGGGLIVFAMFLLAADWTTRNNDWPVRLAALQASPANSVQDDLGPRPDLREGGFAAMPPVSLIADPATDPRFLVPHALPPGQLERILAQLAGAAMPDGQTSDPPFSFTEALQRHKGAAPDLREGAAARRAERTLVRHAPFVARQYAHTRTTSPLGDDTRTDFTETVFWHPVLVLPQNGRASVSFALSDSIQAYRVLVAGHTLDGRLGSAHEIIEVRKPLSLDQKLPTEVTAGDRIELPVIVSNATAANQDVKFSLWSDHLRADEAAAERTLSVPPRGSISATVPLTVPANVTAAKIRTSGRAKAGLGDAVERSIAIAPDGFPASGAVSGVLNRTATATVTLPDQLVSGTLAAKVVVYTNTVSQVQSGLDGLLREPHGCFEQSSTANYPNVLILDYLREIGQHKPTVIANARSLLERGYARLLGFEVAKQAGDGREGFEWFGEYPPHEALSAYGLMQFADMARVYPVDPGVIDRTRAFLLSRRDGTGGFLRPADEHGFGDVPKPVADAYIVWAITEAERESSPSDLSKELQAVAAAAAGSGDPYHLALAANALLNRREFDRARPLLDQLAATQQPDGSLPGAAHTITRSAGPDVVTETTALAALAWLKDGKPSAFEAHLRAAMRFLHTQRTAFGAFGGTQATILTLKAITEYARIERNSPETGRLIVRINGVEVGSTAFDSHSQEPAVVEIADLEQLLRPGANAIEIECTGQQTYPFTVAWAARIRTPASDPACVVKLTTAPEAADVAAGQTVRLSVRVENTTELGQGMTVAVVGLPAGLKLPADAAQLKALTAAGTVDHWELLGRELVFYWRGLAPRQAVLLAVDLIADVPGEYRAPAGRAYLYYHPQAKHWVNPLAVRIRPANP